MSDLLRELRFAARTLRRTPAFTGAAIATLALGIGATTAIFSTVNAALLRPLPYPRWQDLRSVRTRFTDGSLTSGLLAPVELARLNDPVVRAAGTLRIDATLIRNDGTPVQSTVYGVTEGFFDLFGLPMTLGRGFTHEDYVGQGPFVAIVSHRVWREMFASDPNMVGTTVRFAELSTTVVGVVARDLDLPQGTDFWFNVRMNPQSTAHTLDAYLRAPPGTTPERLRGELASVMAGLARDFPGPETNRDFVVRPLVDAIVGDLGPTLVVVLSATALLLVLACVNVTNLFLARETARAREMTVRAALGASRWRLVRQLLIESVALATGGAVAGLFLAYAGVRLLLLFGASKLPRLEAVPFDVRVLLFTGATVLVSAVLVGLAPALHLTRADLKALINESGRTATGGRSTYRLLRAMIVVEIAVAVTLVAGAGWLVRSFNNLQTSDAGFKSEGRVVFDLLLPFSRYKSPAQALSWSHELQDRLRGISGVVGVGSASSFPLRTDRDATPLVDIQGEPGDSKRTPVVSRMRIVSPGFFKAMGITMVSGRPFTDDDRPTTAPVAIVNQTFVRRYLGGKQPSTVQIAFGFPTVDPGTLRAIVGIVHDVKYASLNAEPEPAFYLALDQRPMLRQSVIVATSLADPNGIVPALRAEVKRMDPQLALEFESVAAIVASTISRQQLGVDLMLVFGVIALVLAGVGIYGVVAYASAQRRGEVATRIALGAQPGNIFWLIMGQGRTLAAVGSLLGLMTAYSAGRIASSWLYEVRASDPLILTLALVLVLGMTLLAMVIPARRAARLDPVLALRSE
jgi:putative ABC transport system permease protein